MKQSAEREKKQRKRSKRVNGTVASRPPNRNSLRSAQRLSEKEAQLPDLLKLAEEVEVQLTDVDKKEKKEKKDLLAKQQRTSDDLTKLKADIKRAPSRGR
jgi:hypothetical protein